MPANWKPPVNPFRRPRSGKALSWYARRVHRYEQMRFDQEPDRRVLPFRWGLEYLGGQADDPDPRAFLGNYVAHAVATSDQWFEDTPAVDYAVEDNVLSFSSQIESPWHENNRVHAQYFPVRLKRAAVVVLAQWNAKWEEQQAVCRYLNKLGIAALKVSLPYHDRRAIPGHPRADHLVGPNIGLTIQANRQAVLDVKRALRWLESQHYRRLGIVGTSIGSCIGFITMCHEPAIEAGAFLHVSTYFGEVVSQGLTTTNVWEPLKEHVTREELTRYWSPISPFLYISKLRRKSNHILAITGKYDPTFWPELTQKFLDELRCHRVPHRHMSLPCGHYSLGSRPFSYAVGYRFGRFLKEVLL